MGFGEQHPLKDFGELWSIFGEHKFLIVDILDASYRNATKFCMVGGLSPGWDKPEMRLR